MSTFRIEVSYSGEPQELGSGLNEDQAAQAASAFLRDMLGLPGSVVTRLVIEREAV